VKLALIGCGHIGGSLALALKRAGAVETVVGEDADPAAAERARELGILDQVGPPPASADVVVVAVPPRAVVEVCRRLHGGAAVVTDVGSVKASIVRGAESVLGGRFVGGHPMAGTERSGPDSADPALFVGRRVILTPTPQTRPDARARVRDLWLAAGAEVVDMTPEAHDAAVAALSHLPHAVAYSLAGVLAGRTELAGLAGPSFRDGTRVAATSPALWIDVLQENREALLPLLDALGARLAALRAAVAAGDADAIGRLLAEGRAARESILG
jgi:prephenate dehydrogenase